MMRKLTVTCALAVTLVGTACGSLPPVADPTPPPSLPAATWEALIEAEDARAATPADIALLRSALASSNAAERAIAVRALGRTERPESAADIRAKLSDPDERVRAAAAHALGDVTRATGAEAARRALMDALDAADASPAATAAAAETLGRLRTDSADARAAATRLAALATREDAARLGALRGLYFLARQPAARAAVGTEAGVVLRGVGAAGADPRERTLALATLALARTADESSIRAGLSDADAQVRREAAASAATIQDTAAVARLVAVAAGDRHPAVRYEAVRVYATRLAASHGCAPLAAAAEDRALQVSLLAIDRLGTACGDRHAALLLSLAQSAGDDWQRAAHATVSLAAIDPARARASMHALARHTSAFARAYAARAAAAAADTALLRDLARDTDANVRTAAVTGLAAVAGHAADAVFVAQLASNESELLMAAAAALEGSRVAGLAVELIDALDRVTALRRETSRDARMALLARIDELGNAALSARINPYLTDFDHAVAVRAADILTKWTGARPTPAPAPLPRQAMPTHAEAVQLAQTSFVLEMADGGEVEIRLLPFDAPANAARFARLARSGYFDGLTIHRVVPNFVVQGGSPGANEYSGDGPFTRDELGEPNWRGTVGLSTRGRDTGDAQFFINLVDNVRLDHEYTVFGVVVRGMDVVDGMAEGAVIRRVSERPVR